MSVAERWSEALAGWAIPEEILAVAPESPWGFPTEVFVTAAREALVAPPTPTHRRALEALPLGGVVLDVGAGAGAASLPLTPRARGSLRWIKAPRCSPRSVVFRGTG